MLTKFRIEVEEGSPEECVEALWMYEHILQQTEAARYGLLYRDGVDQPGIVDTPPGEAPQDALGRDGVEDYYNGQLGRELGEEVIEFDPSIPAYKARRVVRFEVLSGRAAFNKARDRFAVGETRSVAVPDLG